MDALEAKKNEGNVLFQQQRFAEAAQTYSSVLDDLLSSGAAGTDDVAARLDTAVRLNRTWAWIQMPTRDSSASTLAAAAQDCSAVIDRDPSCVKAFYRRALARERMGHWKLAVEDATTVKSLEPGNPFVGPLLERLQQRAKEEKDVEELGPKFQQCAIDRDGNSKNAAAAIAATITLADEAENAWRALQADERNFQKVYHASTKSRRKPKKLRLETKAVQNQPVKGNISEKTDDIWASLRREETTTVAKAFPRSRKSSAAS
ncbi:hypothetical protein PF005_g5948 [Phytophthora fragariae]|uniref:Uncharacterized protein n=1 Tax=Phytophthora fragariae TaxID=53985 RepID=A0A6A3UFK5_9STRA|nr:hypothetical protein PF003_g4416 [Phytophthora fragariae]KAE8943727.1 hypothetical protein PF009_g6570 [Phytophthora fragariae]KAE9026869.1 hypothetical protein PF011_g2315 [Phytophthora fragariae]KAE9126287.1 hypothetical protein PF007_g6048 [Phytophthora fragariae]KAE9127198.1 hypothetical protein PF010_g5007 [Phytophthora fragariae]